MERMGKRNCLSIWRAIVVRSNLITITTTFLILPKLKTCLYIIIFMIRMKTNFLSSNHSPTHNNQMNNNNKMNNKIKIYSNCLHLTNPPIDSNLLRNTSKALKSYSRTWYLLTTTALTNYSMKKQIKKQENTLNTFYLKEVICQCLVFHFSFIFSTF